MSYTAYVPTRQRATVETRGKDPDRRDRDRGSVHSARSDRDLRRSYENPRASGIACTSGGLAILGGGSCVGARPRARGGARQPHERRGGGRRGGIKATHV